MAIISAAVNLVVMDQLALCHHMSQLAACRSSKIRPQASTNTAGRKVASFFLAVAAAVEFCTITEHIMGAGLGVVRGLTRLVSELPAWGQFHKMVKCTIEDY
jgi:hypothetical protein